MKNFILSLILVSGFAVHADALFLCSDAQTGCTPVATGVQPSTLFTAASMQAFPMDCSASCRSECRIDYNDCLRNGTTKSECAALRGLCESHCRN